MTILEKVRTTGLLMDGAMGSRLIQKGMKSSVVPELMNLEKPDIVLEVHQEYIAAGADAITTNTFGGTRLKLKKAGIAHLTAKVNQMACKIARQAAGKTHYVAGNLGPLGEMLEPFGMLNLSEAVENFQEQAQILAESGIDCFIIETMFDVRECQAAIQGVRAVSDLPVFATMTFEKNPNGFCTIMGNFVPESMQMLAQAGADAVGANCSIGSDSMVELAKIIRKSVTLPVIIQPNAGIPEIRDGGLVYPESSTEYASNLKAIRDLGVEIIGGCCGTTPEYIQAIRRLIS
jgi:5-methyltetrahydrofolate--homocysteine methyltransferase